MLSHFVRRGVQHAAGSGAFGGLGGDMDNFDFQMPSWGIAILGGTVLIFLIASIAVEYTIRLLIINLAIVESPTSTTVQRYALVSDNDAADAPLGKREDIVDIAVETAEIPNKPLTSSIRKTVRHLKSIGGRTALWRGLRLFGLYSLITALVASVFSLIPPRGTSLASVIGNIVAGFFAARIHCAWTHKTIAMPSNKKLSERLITRSQQRQLLAPTAVKILVLETTYFATLWAGISSFSQLDIHMRSSNPNKLVAALLLCAPFATLLAGFFFAVLPAYVALIRIEASLLPEDEDTIVAMDRTFGGSVANISDRLTMWQAWKNFDGRARVVKLYLKFFLISFFLSLVFVHVVLFELWAIVGPQLPVLFMQMRARFEAQSEWEISS